MQFSSWDRIDGGKYLDEAVAVAALLDAALPEAERVEAREDAIRLVEETRALAGGQRLMEGFLAEFSLDTDEGLALMTLAEALIRTPDNATRDLLIAEKIGSGDWHAHRGQSPNTVVNLATRGLALADDLLGARAGTDNVLKRLAARVGEPVIRRAVRAAVAQMGNQFVLGRTIGEALRRARKRGFLCSFDMLGEGARTEADAVRYEHIYAAAIEAVGRDHSGLPPEEGHGISVKLSALCPRYAAVQEDRVWDELYPRLKRLAVMAAAHDLNLAIDAEEADRLVLSLKLVERLAHEPDLDAWDGLGVVVQAYQKRACAVIDGLHDLARRSGRRLMIRLVKGAYWDSEIKRAQIAGRPDYPVFTTKAATDVSFLVCADRLIAASPHLYPQFATHNAHTLVTVRHMAAARGVPIEHQRLHGMGESLYAAAAKSGPLRVRAYAPVGGHEELLPYLVRRLLENGANSSFVNALLDEEVPPAELVRDPFEALAAAPGRHPKIPLPSQLYGSARANPLGRDYSVATVRASAGEAAARLCQDKPLGGPVIGGENAGDEPLRPLRSPVDGGFVGLIRDATAADVDRAVAAARQAQPQWDRRGGTERAAILRRMAEALEARMDDLIALLAREAGKTLEDGVAEVREAVDFCRYYAGLAERQFGAPMILDGPVGETNALELHGRGIFVCISPWNFPLAIFTGQVAAALAAGNTVLAKPAEQTPLIAAEAVRLFHRAGLPKGVLALLPGEGGVTGAALVAHPGIDGVAFTGGTQTAWRINRSLALREGPILPFIAETGGLNGMFVDTTALREQVVDDVILSAFGSAGQRCSALRMLFVPEANADATIEAIAGAIDQLRIGDPSDPSTDIGPVIDGAARTALAEHALRLDREARIVRRLESGSRPGSFFGPILAEVPRPDFLEREVFGPILHVYRYRAGELDSVAELLARRGYGLTLGIHSRLDCFADRVRTAVPAGNVYVNRSMVGAVVGVQPFGGEGLSGTGPKAGGPHALLRYATERAVSINIAAQGGDPALLGL
ncbi:bifunctional proline dehydrogenase/L-glutamate gamma-semialdehyde dehydrogenase PutA [Sphingomonas sp. JC676]|uniref:bifunctional proline dehydrogenase/L-glutamate gamma-semialdehyde dehydrogenase PutA n=1 Tax=Sphingomonas sp. JC676 TaxID=2768065 RepID=UPI001657E4B2|nr:bifunctional proline dehydrogenase/L-glutamate gamma-semialdehyde dehydrogenase PutA [Sphingomonas sp. JC676]MBC9033748.1 bifunctional proline dehydrogenase/L-glutamate gamma-semialdehyde dehydrogenase PutA [Sphingomonas sp. JC676]